MINLKKILKEHLPYITVLILLTIIFNIKLPYYVSAPGGIIDISNRIKYEDKIDYKGSLNMLYVTEYIATLPIYLMSHIMPNWDLESIEESQISDETVEEIDIRNKIMLDNSINNAKYVAYKASNKKIEITNKKHQIVGTITKTKLKIGDEILEVNNNKINDLLDIKKIIEKSNIDDELTFKIIRNKKELILKEKVKKIDKEKALGVVIMTNYEYETDPNIELKFKRSESGSSGGLMMSLSIYSAISEKDILKGRNIAGTGTIDIDGNVGEIDGIKYKIMGAAKNNMDIVLVPKANYKEAIKTKKENNYDLEIVSIKTFEDAIDYLTKTK